MRLTLLTNYDLPSALALRHIRSGLTELNQKTELSVFFTYKQNISESLPLQLQDLIRFERSHKRLFDIFSQCGAKELNHINQASGLKQFTSSSPDLVLSVRHMSILKEQVIQTPRFGVINLHSGPLPEYQGVMATFWAMKNQEQNIGTTLHWIEDSTIDTGAVIDKTSQPIDYKKSYLWNTLSLYRDGCAMVINAIKAITEKSNPSSEIQNGQANYYSFPRPIDYEQFENALFDREESLASFFDEVK